MKITISDTFMNQEFAGAMLLCRRKYICGRVGNDRTLALHPLAISSHIEGTESFYFGENLPVTAVMSENEGKVAER